MKINRSAISKILSTIFVLAFAITANAQSESFNLNLNKYPIGLIFLAIIIMGSIIAAVLFLSYNSKQLAKDFRNQKKIKPER